MEIPSKIIDGLTDLILSGYEWRLVLVIIQKTYAEEKEWAEISLDDFARKTKIKKPHLSRELSRLQERSVVRKRIVSGNWTWKLNPDTESWRSFLAVKMPNSIPKRTEIAWEKWIARYPNPIHVEDAKAMYVSLVMQNGSMVEKLDDCLDGYIKMKKHQDIKYNRDPDPLMCMYPTTFLRDKKYEAFERFKFLKQESL